MGLFLGIILLACVILFRVLPVVITLVIFCNMAEIKKDRKRRLLQYFAIASACGLDIALYIFLHRIMMKNWNIFQTMKDIVHWRFSYQDILYFPVSLIITTLFSVILGWLLKYGLSAVQGKDGAQLSRQRRSSFLLLSLSGIGLAVLGSCCYSINGLNNIVINEAYAGGEMILLDDGREISDYIELYNKGILPCELDHLYLSDDEAVLRKMEISNYEVPAGGHVLAILDQSGAFALKKEGGETVYLSDARGRVLDQVPLEGLLSGVAYARQTDGCSEWGNFNCTPERANMAVLQWVAEPQLSFESGFYSEPFELEMISEPGTSVYYTLDGRVPTVESMLYTKPIFIYNRSGEDNVYRSVRNVVSEWLEYEPDLEPVDKATVIWAIAVGADGTVSQPVTATYFVGLDQYRQSEVISIVADPEDLWGDNGIYVTGWEYDDWYLNGQEGNKPPENFNRHGRGYEVEASFTYFSEKPVFSQDIGLRISGASSRWGELKRFALYARKEYGGSDYFDEEIFPETSSRRLLLRKGAANALFQELVRDRNVATQRYRCVTFFLNGEFWYYTNLMEQYESGYFENQYGIDRDNVIVCKAGEITEGIEEDAALYQSIYDFLDTHKLSDSSAYDEFGRLIDLQSYIDYMCINIYVDNIDFSEIKNNVMWRSRDDSYGTYGDGRWRFALYDLDAIEWWDYRKWNLNSQQEKNSFSIIPQYVDGPINQQRIYQALKVNPDFCRRFVLTFMDLVNVNFRYENVRAVIEEYDSQLRKANGGQEAAWNMDNFDSFFKERAAYATVYLAEEFGLSGSQEQVVLSVNDPEAGFIRLNTVEPDLSDGPWSGIYYTDYPVSVEAIARPGYMFERWEGESHSKENHIEVPVKEGGISLRAVFRKIDL